jgi:hypothetical protein
MWGGTDVASETKAAVGIARSLLPLQLWETSTRVVYSSAREEHAMCSISIEAICRRWRCRSRAAQRQREGDRSWQCASRRSNSASSDRYRWTDRQLSLLRDALNLQRQGTLRRSQAIDWKFPLPRLPPTDPALRGSRGGFSLSSAGGTQRRGIGLIVTGRARKCENRI